MNHYHLLFAAIALSMALPAASQKKDAGDKFVLSGTLRGVADGTHVYLCEPLGRQLIHLDSATVEKGQFRISNYKYTEDKQAYIEIGTGKEKTVASFFIENLPLTLTQAAEGAPLQVKGSPLNEANTELNLQLHEITPKLDALVAEYRDKNTTEARRSAIEKEAEQLEEKLDALKKTTMEKHADNLLGLTLLSQTYYGMEVDEVANFLKKLPTTLQQTEKAKRLQDYVNKQQNAGVGRPFIDVALKTPEGKDIKLSDYVGKGKYVLLDFWASWCGPCRAEMPNVVKAYETYKDKGFEIVSISLDRDGEAWKKAIADLHITWPQMSDLKYWQCEGAQRYGISSIPATVLFDPRGIIVAKNLRGEQLCEKLGDLIK